MAKEVFYTGGNGNKSWKIRRERKSLAWVKKKGVHRRNQPTSYALIKCIRSGLIDVMAEAKIVISPDMVLNVRRENA